MKKVIGNIAVVIVFLAVGFSASLDAEPWAMGEGNKSTLLGAYLDAQYQDRYGRVDDLETIKRVYAIEQARRVCSGWHIQPQEEYNFCVETLEEELLK